MRDSKLYPCDVPCYLYGDVMPENKKIDKASDIQFREQITENIPGETASRLVWAGALASYVIGKKRRAKRNK